MYKPNLKSISENVCKFYTEKCGKKSCNFFLDSSVSISSLNFSSVILYRFKHERYKIINKDIKIVKMQKINSKKYKQLSFHS